MAYRITTHKGRTTKGSKAYSARHLDRKFPLKNAPHIDPTRTHLNRYVEFDVDLDGTLLHKKSKDIQRHELATYERLFKPRLDIVNENYIKQRHKEKCKQKYNNRQMVFSEEIRETFADICEQMYGLEIEREARDASKSGKNLATYQRDKAVEDVEILTQERDKLQEEVSALKRVISRFKRILAPLSKL